MTTFVIIISLSALLFVILYALLHRSSSPAGKPEDRGDTRSSRRKVDPTPARSSDPQGSAADETPSGYTSPKGIHPGLTEGMDRIFSVETPPSELPKPRLRIEDIEDEVRREVLSQIASLKNIATLGQLQTLMGDPKTTMTELSRMVTSNPILSARILQVANSPYYRMQQKLNSISHAIMIIGMTSLKAIVYHEGVLQALQEKSFRDKPVMQALWRHMNYTSIYASYLHYLFGGLNIGNLFTLGLLHDIGKFIMLRLVQKDNEPARDYTPCWTMLEEEAAYGINHALVGRLALQHWQLSPLMVETVTLHHAPTFLSPAELVIDRETMQYLLVLFLADGAARLFAGADGEEPRIDRLHPGYHDLIDRNKLTRLITDKSLLTQLREAEAIIGVYA